MPSILFQNNGSWWPDRLKSRGWTRTQNGNKQRIYTNALLTQIQDICGCIINTNARSTQFCMNTNSEWTQIHDKQNYIRWTQIYFVRSHVCLALQRQQTVCFTFYLDLNSGDKCFYRLCVMAELFPVYTGACWMGTFSAVLPERFPQIDVNCYKKRFCLTHLVCLRWAWLWRMTRINRLVFIRKLTL